MATRAGLAAGAGAWDADATVPLPRIRRRRVPVRPATAVTLLVLTVLSFVQRPGEVTFDTKLDLAVRPAAFLARALHLWNPEATFGELQNQAYGYLFPVGPFFVLTDTLGVPTWIAQRAWSALLLVGAFVGALWLARALGLGTEPARYAGAFGYTLAPRVLTEIGPLSVEMLPAVLLPWVLLPLIAVRRIGSPRRAAALSGLAVLAMGGVNGSMVLMSLALPVLWLATRRWTRDHLALVGWWCVSVLAATLWWIVPLLLLAGYSLPFLDYIESAADTTAPLSIFQVLRGTNQWVAYVVQGEPWWPAGFVLISNPVLMAATATVAAVALYGLAKRELPQRLFLLLGMLVGLLALTMGHVGALDSPVAEWWRSLLDGPLAAFRNVHKFDPVLRLCLAMGFIHAVSPTPAAAVSVWPARWRAAVAGVLVLVVAAPAWLGMLRPGPGWTEVPGHWREAAAWLADRDATARTLLLPATGFGEYRWGRTIDEPMQALARSPWAVRNQVPLGSEGNTRFMDAVSDTLTSGRGSPALAAYLRRAGVRFLALRNDIDRTTPGLPPAAVLHQSLERSGGIEPVATFGPRIEQGDDPLTGSVDTGRAYPAIEVFEVGGEPALASVAAASDVVTISGGPESVLSLLEQGVLDVDQPTVLAGETDETGALAEDGGRLVVTDGLRRRERNVGRVHDNLSATLAPTDPVRQRRITLDVLPLRDERHQTVAQYDGLRSVRASSSAGYADALWATDPSHQPFAAVDGEPTSAWHSSSFTGPAGQWLEVELDTPRVLDTVRLDLVEDLTVGWPVARIRITTDRGSIEHDVPELPGAHEYPVFAGPSSTVRVTVLAMRGDRDNGNVGIRELAIPGVSATRMLQAPTDVADVDTGGPATLAFTRGTQPRSACVRTGGELRCDPRLGRIGEEPAGVDRRFKLAEPASYAVSGTVLARQGRTPWTSPRGLEVSASSQLAGDPALAPRLLFDGDPDTAWIADHTDQEPTLRLRWLDQRRIDRIELTPSRQGLANPPVELVLTGADQTRTLQVEPGQSVLTFEPLDTSWLDIQVVSADQLPFGQPDRPGASAGLAELRIPALDGLFGTPDQQANPEVAVPCGLGPAIDVDGKRYPTELRGSYRAVGEYQALTLTPCGELLEGLQLSAGEHRVRTVPTDQFVVQDLTLTPSAGLPARAAAQDPDQGRTIEVRSWGTVRRQVEVSQGGDAYLVVPENANPGWVATVDGVELRPLRVDGWQQAWLVPAGAAGTVDLRFEPDDDYRTGLLVGGGAALLLLVLCALPVLRRRGPPAVPDAMDSWWPVAGVVTVLLLLLGGPFPLIALLGCLLLRRLWRSERAMPVVAAGGMLAATAVAVAGRLTDHGQAWAFGGFAQAAGFVAITAVIAAFLYPAAVPDADPPEPDADEAQ